MEDHDVGMALDDIEADYAVRLKQYAPEAASVLREIMVDDTNDATLRATVAQVLLDMAYREETRKQKSTAKPQAAKG
jgi:hypothetical protein